MSKSATEQFQIKKKRKHPLSVTSTAPINRTYKRNVLHTVSSTAATTATAADLLIKENFAKFQIDTKETAKFNSLLQIKSLAGAVAAATAAATFDNLSDSKKCIITTPTAATTLSANTVSTLAAVKNCLRDQSQVLILNSPHVNMPLSHKFYVKGALATKRGLKDLKTNAASGSASLASCEAAKRPRKGNENLKLCSPSVMAGQKTTTANNLQLSYMLGESLARHGRLQEAFDIYALIASEQPEGFIPLEKLNILATALLEHIRILSSNSKKSHELSATEPVKGLSNEQQQQLVTPMRSKYISASASAALNWPLPVMSLNAQSSKLKDLGTEYLATAVGGNLDLHSPTRELAAVNDTITLDDFDPLMCPLCRDVLRCPVTTNCGHTFCRQCCETITMCNICHIKFPRWQKDDSSTNINGNITSNGNNYSLNHKLQNMTTSLATLSTATTTTTSIDLTTTTQSHLTFNLQQIYSSTSSFTNNTSVPSISASAFTPSNSTSTSSISSSTVSTPLAAISGMPRLQLITTPLPTPTTVTTTTIACTTDTATTTMASTASTSGVELRSTTSNDNMKFMPDVLVRRLVEKWWGADLQAKKINETATSYMHLNLLDDALKFCNASLEKSPTNFKSLLLRAEVLRKMNHQQSSLADVDNALKTRYTSAKAHYIRALALSDLSRYEEALYETCLAIGMDKSSNLSNTELFQHDLTKILQKLLSQTPKCLKVDLSSLRSKAPYSVYTEQRLRHKNISLLNRNTVQEDDFLNLYEDDDFLSANYGQECDILADEDMLVCADFLNCADKRTTYASIAKKYELELKRQTTRKHFRRKWMQKETELLPPNDVESARCSSQFRNVLERMQQEIVRLKKIESSPEYLQRQQVSVNPSLIDASDFDCVLCCRTFWKPVVTPCGHTYCLVCLDRCMDYTSSCPLCMSPLVEPSLNIYQQGASSPVPLMLTKRSVTKFLEAAMKRFIPDSYNKRFRQEMVMEPSVPIFICTTAFPYVPCPLFVYEPRYRLMVRRAVESGDKQFGIVQPHSGKSRYYDYGCILDIRDCVLLGDGCSILSTIGCKRFKILARNEKDGYETAKVEYIHDETIPDEHLSYVGHMHDVVLSKAKQWYQSLGEDLKHEILQSYGEMPVVEDNWETIADGPAWAWWIIALLPLRPQLKVDILATTSLEKRLRAIEKTIHSMPGNCHYQTVTQNCDVAVVVQHHNHNANENVQDHHHLHHHHHRHPDVEDDDENNLSHNGVDGEDDIVLDEEQNLLEHHLVNENIEQQHAAHMPLEQQQQQMHQHQCENVTTVDECCQRTNANAYEHDELDLESETHDTSTIPHRHHHHQHQHHHNNHHRQQRHHRTGHTHTLLL